MSVFKCKMCGGSLEITDGSKVATCEYCGTQQTLPKTSDEVVANLFNRANNLRLKCEFDKAAQIYEKIVEQDDSEAEAHWGLILCKYGIEYVEDPKTHQRIPTCHRTLFDAVTADADYQAAVDYSDPAQQQIYEKEARAIDKIQRDILVIVKNEKPFDVFICYKETDDAGKRTVDSTIANDIYYQLTQEGFKVFYAAITLEDKLGQEYEPYIFAALNSAKVMLVLGTKPEYFSAVWVKNEWSRFLQLMKTDRSKLLIPCYRDMDAYDLPEEFAHLQAQDMSKIGFINDIARGIKKVIASDEPKPAAVTEAVIENGNTNISALLKRIFIFLEDGEFDRADDFCEQVLNQDPECAEAYLGKLMAEFHVRKQEGLKDCSKPFDDSNNYQKAVRFGDEELKASLAGYIGHINTRNENVRLNKKRAAKKLKKVALITISAICMVIVFLLVLIHAYRKNDFIATYGQEVYDRFGLVEEGAYISFGEYEQDNNASNGKEDIEWVVLEIKDNKMLVASKFVLDNKNYNDERSQVTWETCTLRKWLNDEFFNSTFSGAEKEKILEACVDANNGSGVYDKVFILSATETNKYFDLICKKTETCRPTEYALANGVSVGSSRLVCYWWTRQTEGSPSHRAWVASYKDAESMNLDVAVNDLEGYVHIGVRPAMWIDLNA